MFFSEPPLTESSCCVLQLSPHITSCQSISKKGYTSTLPMFRGLPSIQEPLYFLARAAYFSHVSVWGSVRRSDARGQSRRQPHSSRLISSADRPICLYVYEPL